MDSIEEKINLLLSELHKDVRERVDIAMVIKMYQKYRKTINNRIAKRLFKIRKLRWEK